MESLAFELQDAILCHAASRDDLKAVRLLNKNFCDVATPHLYRRVFISVRKDSFDRLNQICASDLRRHVRCLHYNIWEPPLISQREWKPVLQEFARAYTDDHWEPLAQCQAHKVSHHDQEMLDDSSFFKKAFQRLPALRSLEFSEREPTHISKSESEPDSAAGTVIHFDLTTEVATSYHSLSHHFHHPSCPTSHDSSSSPDTSRVLGTIIAHSAAFQHDATCTLQSLTLHNFRWHWLDMHDVRMWHEPSKELRQALSGLKRLSISVEREEDGSAGAGDGEEQGEGVPDLDAAVEVWRKLVGEEEEEMVSEELMVDGQSSRG